MIRANHSKKTYFFYVFDSYSQFFPFLCPSAHPFHHSLLSRCFLKSDRSNLLFKKSDHERIADVALYKRATMRDSLRSLMTKEQWSDLLFFMSESIFSSQKTSNLIEKPMSKFPTLDRGKEKDYER